MPTPTQIPEPGTLLFVTRLVERGRTTLFVHQRHDACRRAGDYCKFHSVVPGTCGDGWFCEQRDGSIAAYWIKELDDDPESAAAEWKRKMEQPAIKGDLWPAWLDAALAK